MIRLQATFTKLLLTTGLLCTGTTQAKLMYHIQDLGSFYSVDSETVGNAINDAGQVTGTPSITPSLPQPMAAS